jgi:hypothetical protein
VKGNVPGSETTASDTDNEDMSENTITIITIAHGNQGQGGNLFAWKSMQ